MFVFAYLDPISGSFVFQALAAGAMVALFYARQLTAWAKGLLGIETVDPDAEDDEDVDQED